MSKNNGMLIVTNKMPPRYTSNGFSHTSLRNRAKAIKQELDVPNIAALNIAAKEINYANWNAIIKEKPNRRRDDFFYSGFKDKENQKELYNEFLRARSLDDSLKSYRKFLIHSYVSQESSGITVPFVPDIDDPSGLLDEILTVFKIEGPDVLLPHIMPESQFFRVYKIFDCVVNDEWPAGYVETSACENLVYALVVLILAETRKVGEDGSVKISTSEIECAIKTYYIRLVSEYLSRVSNIVIEKPVIDTLLDDNIVFTFSKDFSEKYKELYPEVDERNSLF